MSSNAPLSVGRFSLTPPGGWQVASLILLGPPDSGAPGSAGAFQQNLVVVCEKLDENETLDGYVARQTQKLKEQGAMFRPPGPMEKVPFPGGRQAVLFEHVVLGPQGEKVRQMQMVTLKEGTLHALIVSHLDGLPFEAARDDFSGLLRSVSLD